LAPSYPLPAVEANRQIEPEKRDLAKIRKGLQPRRCRRRRGMAVGPATSGSSGSRRHHHGLDHDLRIAVNS